jgi:hypothetical protein
MYKNKNEKWTKGLTLFIDQVPSSQKPLILPHKPSIQTKKQDIVLKNYHKYLCGICF